MSRQEMSGVKKFLIRSDDIQILKLRVEKGLTQRETAEKLNITQRTVQRREEALRKIWPDVRDFVSKIEENGELKAFVLGEKAYRKTPIRWMRQRWIEGYHLSSVPYGFRKDGGGNLVPVPKEIEKVAQIFEEFLAGKSGHQLHNETGLPIHRMLRNPVYIGMVRFKGKIRPGRHDAVISLDLFHSVQKEIAERSHRFNARPLPYGYEYQNDRVTIVPEKANDVREMFKLRCEHKSYSEISRLFGMTDTAVRRRIKNPFYSSKKKVKGKWVDLDHDPIVDIDTWLAANRVQTKCIAVVARMGQESKKLNRNRILKFLANKTLTARQIAEGLGLNPTTVHKHLQQLLREEIVERIYPNQSRDDRIGQFRDVNRGVFLPFKWRIRT